MAKPFPPRAAGRGEGAKNPTLGEQSQISEGTQRPSPLAKPIESQIEICVGRAENRQKPISETPESPLIPG
jgi:hypothetical protein